MFFLLSSLRQNYKTLRPEESQKNHPTRENGRGVIFLKFVHGKKKKKSYQEKNLFNII
jgi:hypothetical protein